MKWQRWVLGVVVLGWGLNGGAAQAALEQIPASHRIVVKYRLKTVDYNGNETTHAAEFADQQEYVVSGEGQVPPSNKLEQLGYSQHFVTVFSKMDPDGAQHVATYYGQRVRALKIVFVDETGQVFHPQIKSAKDPSFRLTRGGWVNLTAPQGYRFLRPSDQRRQAKSLHEDWRIPIVHAQTEPGVSLKPGNLTEHVPVAVKSPHHVTDPTSDNSGLGGSGQPAQVPLVPLSPRPHAGETGQSVSMSPINVSTEQKDEQPPHWWHTVRPTLTTFPTLAQQDHGTPPTRNRVKKVPEATSHAGVTFTHAANRPNTKHRKTHDQAAPAREHLPQTSDRGQQGFEWWLGGLGLLSGLYWRYRRT